MNLADITFEPFENRPNWFVCADARYLGATKSSHDLATSLIPVAREADCQVFCGMLPDGDFDEHRLFAVRGIHPCDLIPEFRVGSHNAGSRPAEDAEVQETLNQMRAIFSIRPFRPYHIDCAGYHCVFDGQITKSEARKVEQLLRVGLEWYAQSEVDELWPTIECENELHLWWD